MKKAKNKKYIIAAMSTVIVIAIACCCIFLFEKQGGSAESTGSGAGDKTSGAGDKTSESEVTVREDFDGVEDLPAEYTQACSEEGSLETFDYDVTLSDGSGRVVSKTAMVYLPYGYDDGKQYNVFYLMHGYGGSYKTFLGSRIAPRPFKSVLDNMIKNGDIAPTIVVALGYTDAYSDYYKQLEAAGSELVADVVPEIESKYSTYAEGTSEADLIDSRGHRAVGGFSMGGCATWYTLMNEGNYFQYYLPTSMPIYYYDGGLDSGKSASGAKRIYDGAVSSGAVDKGVYIFAASGDEDFMSEATKAQAMDLCAYAGFTYTENSFRDGNVMFHSWTGHKHSYKQSFDYFYNGLMKFFK